MSADFRDLGPSLVEMTGYCTDKQPSFLAVYESLFAPLRERPVALLELGIHHGGSLLMWRDYFAQGSIAGLDQHHVPVDDASGRIRTYQGQQQDSVLLDRIAVEMAPEGFDIVIDDASHFGCTSSRIGARVTGPVGPTAVPGRRHMNGSPPSG